MRRLITILFLLIHFVSFGQYEKLFSDKNINPYNLILKDKFIWLNKEVKRDSLVYAELKTDSVRFRYFDESYTHWFYVPGLSGIRDTLQLHRDSLRIAYERLIEVEGLDTTGIYHWNRSLLDAITASDTTRWGTVLDLSDYTTRTELSDTSIAIRTDIPTLLTELDSSNFKITESQIADLNHFSGSDITGNETAFDDWDKNVNDDFSGEYDNLTNRPILMDNAHEGDPHFYNWNRTTGINIYSKQIFDWDEKLEPFALETDITGGVLDADFTSISVNGESVVINSDLSNYVEWADTTSIIATKYDIDTLSFLRSYTETDSIFNAHLASTITPSDTSWWGTNYWNMTTTGIQHDGNVAVGSYAPDYGALRVTAASDNDWINYNYHRSSAGNGLYVGLTTGIVDERKLLSLNRGTSTTHEFYANGKVKFFNYGSGSTFTGTVENYLATDANGNLIIASGTSGSGDDWGSQVVITDSTLTGNGTSANPLSVVAGSGGSLWESSSGFINPINNENISIEGQDYPLLRFKSNLEPTHTAQLYFDGISLRGTYYNGSTTYTPFLYSSTGIQTTGLLLSNSANYMETNGSIRYNGTDILGRVGGSWVSLTSGGSSSIWSDGTFGYKADTKNLEIYNTTPTLYFNDSQYEQNYSFELLDNGLYVNAYDNDLGTYASATPLKIMQLGIAPTGFYDKNNTRGTAGQILSSTGSSIEWINSPTSSFDINSLSLDNSPGSTPYFAYYDAVNGNVKAEIGVFDADYWGSGTATDGYVLTADGAGNAAWEAVSSSSGGAPTDASYLVTASNATLTNEIVVGTAPSGDLGGTWNAISVNDNSHLHTGSTISDLSVYDLTSVTGTPSSSTYLRGDNTWATPGGSGTVTSVAAGNGMDFTTITSSGTVTLGIPSSVTVSSTNSTTTTSHTHALDLSGRSVLTQYSLTGGGNLGSNRTLNLVGDVASPGNSKYYGTNSSGTRGFYDLPSGSGPNLTVQTLSGTTPAWNMSNGINAKITLSGNTTITLSNVPSGYSGNLTVMNAATAYTITFAGTGYTFKISPTLDASSGAITMSGWSNIDVLSWYFDGTYIIINGTFGYE